MFNHIPVELLDIQSKDTPKGRFYQIDKDTKYPSITTVLGGSADKQWLEDWKTMLGPKKADKESKRCSDRGTAVHKICEDYLNNLEDFTQNHNIENIKLFNKLKMKLKLINNINAQECALYSQVLGVAGRSDCIAEYKGVQSVIDFKTSNNIKKEDMIEDYFFQGAFYLISYNEMYNCTIDQIVIIIAVERSLMPQVFVKKLDKELIGKLLKRINIYKGK